MIQPPEMCNPKVDELSMMTYLSQFPNAKLKPGAPLRPKTNPNRVRAYGPGTYLSCQSSRGVIGWQNGESPVRYHPAADVGNNRVNG